MPSPQPLVAAAGFGITVAALCALLRLRRQKRAGSAGTGTSNSLLDGVKHVFADKPLEDDLNIELDPTAYKELLAALMLESKHVQNAPPENIPEEDKVVEHILKFLKPYTKENGGALEVKAISYVKGRSNIVVRYPGSVKGSKPIGLIGMHLDVVPAFPETWERDPFTLTVEGDKLYGRGTTDCLGHCALVSYFMRELGRTKPNLKSDVVAVFIASEENEDKPGVGVDGLVANHVLDELKSGSCLWIDSSDSEPCIGTAGSATWSLKATGKRFHSGFPNRTVNPIELVSEAMAAIQRRFYEDFPRHPEEVRYGYGATSSFKPTQVKCADGSLNQIPPTATLMGDIRITPFYDIREVRKRISQYVDDLVAEKFSSLPTRGKDSKYAVKDPKVDGKLELEWNHACMRGIACNIDSAGFATICEAVKTVRGSVTPFSICGSLPIIADLQDEGFDMQVIGFGLSSTYHAQNEYCLLSDMVKATRILSYFVAGLNRLLN